MTAPTAAQVAAGLAATRTADEAVRWLRAMGGRA